MCLLSIIESVKKTSGSSHVFHQYFLNSSIDLLDPKPVLENISSWTRASSVLAASWAWTRARVTGAVLWFVRNNREPGTRQELSHLVLGVERLAFLPSMLMCPLLPAGLTDR